MARLSPSWACAWAAGLLVAVSSHGCAGEQEALIVLHSPAFAEGACAVDANSEVGLQQGLLDVSFGTGYILPVILQNNLVSRGTTGTNSGVEPGELQLRDVDVRLGTPEDADIIRDVAADEDSKVDFTVVLPSQSMSPGQRTGQLIEVIDEFTARAMSRALVDNGYMAGDTTIVTASLIFHATRTGNSRGNTGVIDSREYTFPIEIGNGFLINCLDCPGAVCPVNSVQYVGGVCGNAQEAYLVPYECTDAAMMGSTDTTDAGTTMRSTDGGSTDAAGSTSDASSTGSASTGAASTGTASTGMASTSL